MTRGNETEAICAKGCVRDMSEKDRYQPETMKKGGVQKKDPIKALGNTAIKGPDKRALGDAAIKGAEKK